jgi:DNA-binding response OmpR family regulator
MSGIPPRILIVEDDHDFAESLVIALGVRNCQVDVAHSGEEAVRRFCAGRYDLVFMDIKLPGKNGVETLSDILSVHPEARIVMMTGFSEPALLNSARQAGALDVLRKPFKMRQLFSYLDTLPGAES